MIWVDYRAGSKELIAPLKKLGLPVEKTTLEFGDLFWEGRGEKGAPVSIGVEFKTLREFIQAVRTERLQGYQMEGMRDTYKYSYLLVEGELLYDGTGSLQIRKRFNRLEAMPGQMTVQEMLKRRNVLHLCGGLNPIYTVNRDDTLQEIIALYRTWTDTNLDAHKSHIAIYEASSLVTISKFRRSVKTFPGIGNRASLAVEKAFKGNLARASAASVDQWAAIETVGDNGKTRRLGTKVATDIYNHCHGIK